MKKRILSLLPFLALLHGCKESNPIVTEQKGFNFNNTELVLPNNGKGSLSVTPHQLDFRWGDKQLTTRDLGDGTVSITTPIVNDQILSKALIIKIDLNGNVTTQPIPTAK